MIMNSVNSVASQTDLPGRLVPVLSEPRRQERGAFDGLKNFHYVNKVLLGHAVRRGGSEILFSELSS